MPRVRQRPCDTSTCKTCTTDTVALDGSMGRVHAPASFKGPVPCGDEGATPSRAHMMHWHARSTQTHNRAWCEHDPDPLPLAGMNESDCRDSYGAVLPDQQAQRRAWFWGGGNVTRHGSSAILEGTPCDITEDPPKMSSRRLPVVTEPRSLVTGLVGIGAVRTAWAVHS